MRQLLSFCFLLLSLQLFAQPKKPINPLTLLRAPEGPDSLMLSDNLRNWYYVHKSSIGLIQNLSLNGSSLEISGGNTVSLSPFFDNTDEQILSMPGGGLDISGGNILDIISTQAGNRLQYGSDNKLFVQEVNVSSSVWSLNGNDAVYENGNVGIGLSVPTGLFEAKGTLGSFIVASTGTSIKLTRDNNNIIDASSGSGGSRLIFRTNGLNAIYIDEFRKVAMGHTSPQYELDVLGRINSSGLISIGGQSVFYPGNDGPGSLMNADLLDDLSSEYFLNYNNLNNLPTIPVQYWQANGSNIYRATGRIGIGTSSPATIFHLFENNGLTTSQGLLIEQDGTGDAKTTYTLTGFRSWSHGIDNSDGDKYKISASSSLATSTHLTIQASGEVGIGTTTPTELLDVAGNGNFTGDLSIGTNFEINGSTFGNAWWTDGNTKNGLFSTSLNNFYLGRFTGGGNGHDGGLYVFYTGAETRTLLQLSNTVTATDGMMATLHRDGANTHLKYDHPRLIPRTAATGATNVTAQDYVLWLNGAGFSITANLPRLDDLSIEDGDTFIFKCIDATNTVQIVASAAAGDTIDAQASLTLSLNETYWLTADKAAGVWRIMAKF